MRVDLVRVIARGADAWAGARMAERVHLQMKTASALETPPTRARPQSKYKVSWSAPATCKPAETTAEHPDSERVIRASPPEIPSTYLLYKLHPPWLLISTPVEVSDSLSKTVHPPCLHTSAPVSAFQIFTRLSADPLTMCLPSGEHETEYTPRE
jgi:hypothetical protein